MRFLSRSSEVGNLRLWRVFGTAALLYSQMAQAIKINLDDTGTSSQVSYALEQKLYGRSMTLDVHLHNDFLANLTNQSQ